MGLRPIVEDFLRPNQLVVLRWHRGVTFHRVELAESVPFWPWFAIDGTGTAVTVSADSGQAELSFLDPRNTARDILYLKSQTDASVPAYEAKGGLAWLLHGALGIYPKSRHFRAYVKYPKGGHLFGQPPEAGAIQPTQSGNFFGIDGIMSPYENPSNYRPIWIPPMTEITAEFYNDHPTETWRPVINLMFQLLHMENLNPVGMDYEAELCKKMAQGKVAFTFAPMGPSRHLRDYPLSDWLYSDGARVEPVKKHAVARGEL